MASEEVATGITCYLLREHFGLDHITDVYECIQRNELVYTSGSSMRPDYFCADAADKTVIAESKGVTGTRSKLTTPISKGIQQVNNVKPTNLPLRASCSRVVIGTHFCVQGIHAKSEATTIINDPDGEESRNKNPESDTLLRLAYAKCLRFMRQDILAERLITKHQLPEKWPNENYFSEREFPIFPLDITPFGDVIGLYGPTAKALFSQVQGSLRDIIKESLEGFRDKRLELGEGGYAMPNGVVISHEPEKLLT